MNESKVDIISEAFKKILEEMGTEQVTVKDVPHFKKLFETEIKRLERARQGLQHEWVQVDGRGRFTIPQQFRTTLNISPQDILDAQLYPPKNPKGLYIQKEE